MWWEKEETVNHIINECSRRNTIVDMIELEKWPTENCARN